VSFLLSQAILKSSNSSAANMGDKGDDVAVYWEIGIFDAHCHPIELMASVEDIAQMKAKVLTVMSTRSQDQHLAEEAATRYQLIGKTLDFSDELSKYVIPAFGWHPWFSFQLFDDAKWGDVEPDQVQHYKSILTPECDDEEFMRELAPPMSLSQALHETEKRLQKFPAALIGEVGLDRGFRLPHGPISDERQEKLKYGGSKELHTPGSRNGRALSAYRISIDHQKVVLKAQLELAARMGRPVSVHSVQAHGLVFDLMQSMWENHKKPSKREQKKTNNLRPSQSEDRQSANQGRLPFPPRICMHSYSGTVETLKQFLSPTVPAGIYFSFSIVVNFSNETSNKAVDAIKAVPDDRLLIESDLHRAGEVMDDLLVQIIRKVCEIRGWDVEEGAKKLKENWMRFVFG
jgi:Tat protein secretion system quality control protein TatD with DNase activity